MVLLASDAIAAEAVLATDGEASFWLEWLTSIT
jgi:hypothetical protein